MPYTNEELLVPALAELLKQNQQCKFFNYYEGPFANIENAKLHQQHVTSDIEATKSLIRKGQTEHLLEIRMETATIPSC